MAASYLVEFYDRVPGCRVSWPRAKRVVIIYVYIENVLEKKISLI